MTSLERKEPITLRQARNLLMRAVLTQGPDFVYTPRLMADCFYTVESFLGSGETDIGADDPRLKTGCLIGVALDLAGFTEHHNTTTSVYQLTMIPMEPSARGYFGVAQSAQDKGAAWGDAFLAAEDSLRGGWMR